MWKVSANFSKVLASTKALLTSSKHCRVCIPTTVVPRKGHKGHIVKKILQDSQARNKVVDFVLCMGDDISDEKMFTVRPYDILTSCLSSLQLRSLISPFSRSSILLRQPRAKIRMLSMWQLERNQRRLRFTSMMHLTFAKYWLH